MSDDHDLNETWKPRAHESAIDTPCSSLPDKRFLAINITLAYCHGNQPDVQFLQCFHSLLDYFAPQMSAAELLALGEFIGRMVFRESDKKNRLELSMSLGQAEQSKE